MILAPYPRARDTQNPQEKLTKCKKKNLKKIAIFFCR